MIVLPSLLFRQLNNVLIQQTTCHAVHPVPEHSSKGNRLAWLECIVGQTSKFGGFWSPTRHTFIKQKQDSLQQSPSSVIVRGNTRQKDFPQGVTTVSVPMASFRPTKGGCTHKTLEHVLAHVLAKIWIRVSPT